MSERTFTHLEASEAHFLRDARGREIASLEIASCDLGYFVASSAQGPVSGFCGPLGYSNAAPRPLASRGDAFAAGVERIRRWLDHDGADPVRSKIDTWLSSLNPAQRDLFGAPTPISQGDQ